jgi:hypothetical protein
MLGHVTVMDGGGAGNGLSCAPSDVLLLSKGNLLSPVDKLVYRLPAINHVNVDVNFG